MWSFRSTSGYYESAASKQDFTTDEAGILPKDLKLGVFSEGWLWNLPA
ncbi:MAG: DUF4298 domain-containing protein [Oscillospiraceae bacterium]|nr:DUF4298 domain-containing protein [Oscillospiraceae bacterium]